MSAAHRSEFRLHDSQLLKLRLKTINRSTRIEPYQPEQENLAPAFFRQPPFSDQGR
jgi:hypothetical protein